MKLNLPVEVCGAVDAHGSVWIVDAKGEEIAELKDGELAQTIVDRLNSGAGV